MRIAEPALLGLLLTACVQSVIVGPPPLELDGGGKAQSMIVLVERDDPGTSLVNRVVLGWAGATSSPELLPPFSTPSGETTRVVVLLYAETLGELGLSPGALLLSNAAEDACHPEGLEVSLLVPLPAPDAAEAIEIHGAGAPAWTVADAEDVATLMSLRTERRLPNPCAGYRPHDGALPDTCPSHDGCTTRTVFAVAVSGRAIVGRIRERARSGLPPEKIGYLYQVDGASAPTLLRTETSTPAEAAVVIDGQVLLLRDDGELDCLRADSAACTLERPPPLPSVDHHFGAIAATDGARYVVRDDGRLWRYQDAAWRELPLARAAPCSPELQCGGVVDSSCELACRPDIVVRDPDALAVLPYLNAVYRLEGDRMVLDSLPPDERAVDDVAQSIALGAARAAVGTSRGRLLIERAPDSWQHLHSLGSQALFAVTALDDGFLFGGEDGLLGQWYPRFEACAPVSAGLGRITHVVPVGRDLLVIGVPEAHTDRDYVWLERAEQPGAPCGSPL